MGDFEDFIDELGIRDDDGLPAPTWRATIRRGKLMLTAWAPFLITNGPVANLFADRDRAGVAIADLTILGDENDEVSVRYWASGANRDDADEVLATWAEDVGFRRLWLPDCTVVELQLRPERLDRASVNCPTCRSRWSDATPEFWLHVRESRMFPKWCPICGCELPQWVVKAPKEGFKPEAGLESGGPTRASVSHRSRELRQRGSR